MEMPYRGALEEMRLSLSLDRHEFECVVTIKHTGSNTRYLPGFEVFVAAAVPSRVGLGVFCIG